MLASWKLDPYTVVRLNSGRRGDDVLKGGHLACSSHKPLTSSYSPVTKRLQVARRTSRNRFKYRGVINLFNPISACRSLKEVSLSVGASPYRPLLAIIVGFHMTSLKFKLENYRSYRDFAFTMH